MFLLLVRTEKVQIEPMGELNLETDPETKKREVRMILGQIVTKTYRIIFAFSSSGIFIMKRLAKSSKMSWGISGRFLSLFSIFGRLSSSKFSWFDIVCLRLISDDNRILFTFNSIRFVTRFIWTSDNSYRRMTISCFTACHFFFRCDVVINKTEEKDDSKQITNQFQSQVVSSI